MRHIPRPITSWIHNFFSSHSTQLSINGKLLCFGLSWLPLSPRLYLFKIFSKQYMPIYIYCSHKIENAIYILRASSLERACIGTSNSLKEGQGAFFSGPQTRQWTGPRTKQHFESSWQKSQVFRCVKPTVLMNSPTLKWIGYHRTMFVGKCVSLNKYSFMPNVQTMMFTKNISQTETQRAMQSSS